MNKGKSDIFYLKDAFKLEIIDFSWYLGVKVDLIDFLGCAPHRIMLVESDVAVKDEYSTFSFLFFPYKGCQFEQGLAGHSGWQ